ncbi:glycosyltransferase [uncultured Alistipes sp.]|uniref:glycosyltransferase n=1 Tax=uncultured Alistipes sp. TaxID=538949 RepID=UPI00258ECCCB|nr:glycosyltransferase [uncultured Alistipes sp.]
MPKLTLTFLYMEREHIGKDVSCVPYYLGQALGYDVEIVSLTSATNRNFPVENDGIRYKFLFRRGDRKNGWYKLIFFWWYLVCNARKIDILMRFHYSIPTIIEAIIYKIFNPDGKVYVKCDTDHHITEKFPQRKGIKEGIRRLLYKKGIAAIDVISCETSKAYALMTKSDSPYFAFGDKLVYVPNGFDETSLRKTPIKIKSFDEKENKIITVGRLGTKQKNTDMLLESLAHINPAGWKFYFIGPIEPAFQSKIDRFYKNFPDKLSSIIFTGPIYDKQKLWEHYNSAKVFVLTSRWESYGLVLIEARRFGCYLVSTDVGAARDLIGNNECGEYIKQEDAVGLQQALQRIIDLQTPINTTIGMPVELSWEHVLYPVIEKLRQK